MGADYPDWGGQYNNANFFPLFDMAELAARLGSPIRYDRRGSVIFFDTFRLGLGDWSTAYSGGGGSVALSATYSNTDGFSAKITTAAALNATAEITKNLAVPMSDRIGLAALLRSANVTNRLLLRLLLQDASNQYTAWVRTDDAFGKDIDIYTGDAWVTVATLDYIPLGIASFFYMKVVIDQTTKKYERLLIGNEQIDVSAYDLNDDGASSLQLINCRAGTWAKAAGAHSVYIDRAIVTGNEPAN